MSQRFIKNTEDFKCENCDFYVEGNGYTNHCPKCLWSKHVDIDPGDRQSDCGGMMRPKRIEGKTNAHDIVHQCVKCGLEKRNMVDEKDDFEKVIEVGKKL